MKHRRIYVPFTFILQYIFTEKPAVSNPPHAVLCHDRGLKMSKQKLLLVIKYIYIISFQLYLCTFHVIIYARELLIRLLNILCP